MNDESFTYKALFEANQQLYAENERLRKENANLKSLLAERTTIYNDEKSVSLKFNYGQKGNTCDSQEKKLNLSLEEKVTLFSIAVR